MLHTTLTMGGFFPKWQELFVETSVFAMFPLLWLTSEFLENGEPERCAALMLLCDPAERSFSSRV